jgi:uncharacterized membrane protein (UPF0136 family)
MTPPIVLWIYIALLVAGGIMGLIKGGSKISLIMSVAFAIPLILCVLGKLEFGIAKWLLIALLVVFTMRLVKTKKFMPSGLMLMVTLLALAGLQFA